MKPTKNQASKALDAFGRRLRRAYPAAINAADAILARRVAANAAVLTGQMRDSVSVEPARSTTRGAAGGVVVDSEAAAPNEFGTDDMSPQPFIRPAALAEAPAMIRAVNNALKNAP